MSVRCIQRKTWHLKKKVVKKNSILYSSKNSNLSMKILHFELYFFFHIPSMNSFRFRELLLFFILKIFAPNMFLLVKLNSYTRERCARKSSRYVFRKKKKNSKLNEFQDCKLTFTIKHLALAFTKSICHRLGIL